MPVCVRCKTPLQCTCGQPQPIGQVAKQCPLEKGALWIHVTDTTGRNVPNVWAYREGAARAQSDANGLVMEDPLHAGACRVVMEALTGNLATQYDAPPELTKSATIADGAIAYVPFVLKGKARLRVEVVRSRRVPRELFKAAACTVTAELTRPAARFSMSEEMNSDEGVADFGAMTAGEYALTIKFADPADESRYEFVETSMQVRLAAGESKTVAFDVEELYTTVQLLAHCLLTIPKQFWSAATRRWTTNYNGLLDDVADISARVRFVQQTIDAAHGQADAATTNLKVFMVPECFFQGKYGAYEIANVDLLIGRLQDAVADVKWKDWVFVFGTVNGMMGPGEMFNICPVIRGGHGGSRSDYTRLIQKAKFSAELPTRAELTPPEPGLTRDRLVSDDMDFQSSESEATVGRLLQEMLEDGNRATVGALVARHGLTPAHWNEIQPLARAAVAARGIRDFTRDLRRCNLVEGATLDAYAFSGVISASSFESQANVKSIDLCLLRWVPLTPGFSRVRWRSAPAIRANAKAAVGATAAGELPFQFQRDALAARLATISDADWLDILDARTEWENFSFSSLPIVKKVLEHYLQEKAVATELLAPKSDVRELVFSSKRIAGPWIDDAAAALQPIKKIQFGLEICADHSYGTLKKSGRPIDIHLLPSCGMFPTTTSVAARAGGFIFNCDGWNKGPLDITRLDISTGGPGAPTTAGRNPLAPHSAIGRGGGGDLAMGSFVATRVPVAAGLDTPIFGEGPGELHVYPVQPLPV